MFKIGKGEFGTKKLAAYVGFHYCLTGDYIRRGMIPPGRHAGLSPRSPHVWTKDEAREAKAFMAALKRYNRETVLEYNHTTKLYTCPACGQYTCTHSGPVHSHMRTCPTVIKLVRQRIVNSPRHVAGVKAAETRKLRRLQQATPPQRSYTGSYKVEDIKKLLKGFVEGNITREDFHKAADAVRDHYQQITEEIATLRGL